MNFVNAIVGGLLYFLGTQRAGYGVTTGFGSPIFIGLIYGIIYGDIATGLIVGANIQLVYLGIIATGGNIPADQTLAGVIAVPVALELGLDAATAVGLAVPFGILGVFLDQIRRTTNSIWVRQADKDALEGNRKGIFHNAFTYPLLVTIALRFIPVFVINLFGANAVQWAIEVLPEWIIGGFAVAGGILPAMGFAIIIITIGKRNLLPYFIIGYFLVQYFSITVMGAAIFGISIALLVFFQDEENRKSVREGA